MDRTRFRTRTASLTQTKRELTRWALRALIAGLTILGLLLSLQQTGHAQDASAASADALELQQKQKELDTVVDQAEQALASARLDKTKCGTDEALALADVQSGQATARAQAVGKVATDALGAYANSQFVTAASQKSKAKGDYEDAVSDGQDLVTTYPNAIRNDSKDKNSAHYAVYNTTALMNYCNSVESINNQDNKPVATHITNCTTADIVKQVSAINKSIAQSKRDQTGATDIGNTQTAVTALVGVAGAGASLYASGIGADAQKKNAKSAREMCEQQADLTLQNDQKALIDAKTDREQQLANLKMQQAYNRKLASSNVATVDTAATSVGKGTAFSPGNMAKKLATPTTPATPAAGGGGGGPGGSSTGASAVPWTFGNGQEDNGGGYGLPNQPTSAQFGAEGGGGGGGGGGFGMDGGFDTGGPAPASVGAATVDGAGGEMVLGDGGINILMARARRRYGAHANELVRSIDLKSVASKAPAGERVPASAIKNQL